MQKEHLSAVEQAESLVIKKENQFVAKLFSWVDAAKIKAEGCSCTHCQAEVDRAQAAVLRELERLELIPDAVDNDD